MFKDKYLKLFASLIYSSYAIYAVHQLPYYFALTFWSAIFLEFSISFREAIKKLDKEEEFNNENQ